MAANAARTSQQERSDHTVAELIDAARMLFASQGYANTSLDAVCEAVSLTKGALYHHFKGKPSLFEAVYRAEQKRLTASIARAYFEGPANSWAAVRSGALAFLQEMLDPGVQRIVLIDAPGAIDWEVLRESSDDCISMLTAGVERAARHGEVAPHSITALAHILYGALCESALAIARDDDPRRALRDGLAEVDALFDALGVEPVAAV